MENRSHICELSGNDESGTGSESAPFKTALQAVKFLAESDSSAKLYVRKSLDSAYQEIAATALKKAKKGLEIAQKKKAKALERAAADADAAAKLAAEEALRMEKAKSVVLTMNPDLPQAKTLKIDECAENRGNRVAVCGWVHRSRVQGKDMMFIILRDGYGLLQCFLSGKLVFVYSADTTSSVTHMTRSPSPSNPPSKCMVSCKSFPKERR